MCEVLAAIIARKWVVAEASVERFSGVQVPTFLVDRSTVYWTALCYEHFDQVEST